MRLAILQQSYGRFGGAERLALSHYIQLRRMGREVTLFYDGRISPGWRTRLRGMDVKRIPTGVARSPYRLKHLLKFMGELKHFDKIIIHHHVEPILASYLSRLLGARIIWYSGSLFELPWEETITGQDYRQISPTVKSTGQEFYGRIISSLLLSDPLYGFTTTVAKKLDVATVRGFGKILSNSFFLSKFLARAYGLKETPPVVYPGPDPLLEKLASENHASEQDYMLAVGSLIPLKNVASMVRAAAQVKSSKVVLVGDGQERSRLKELAHQLDVPVDFRGNLDGEMELARVYAECKILVHLSLYEPFGLTPVEAGLFSKPSIVTNHGGPPEVVMDGVTGYVVDPRDCEQIGNRMSSLLGDDTLRKSMGQSARENMVQKFTLEKSTRRLIEEVDSR